MIFEWDEAKRLANIAKHGVDFTAAETFDWESAVTRPDQRRIYGEARFTSTGFIGRRLHVLIFAQRGRATRVISLRRANPRERRRYEQAT